VSRPLSFSVGWKVEAGAMSPFAVNHLYTRQEIATVRRGDEQSYLPHHDGRVVCACLDRERNPDAPWVILAGRSPDTVHWGEVFAQQREFVPVFLKRATHAWQYVGDYRVAECSKDQDQIARWEEVSNRAGDLSMVLYLERERD
jgi:hypothetical protein